MLVARAVRKVDWRIGKLALNQMIVSSTPSRFAALALTLMLSGVLSVVGSLGQDITGGSSSELASAADVESRSGRGVFTAPKSVAHHARKLEKKTVARVTVARTQHQTGGEGGARETGGGRETSGRRETSGGRETGAGRETSGGDARTDSDLGSRPLGGAPRRVCGA